MNVLIVSHNCFGRSNNMGKTLLSYFQDFQPEELAQFYIQSARPAQDSLCRRYYRVTDLDAVRSLLFSRNAGGRVEPGTEAPETGGRRLLHRIGEKRTPAGFALRELVWKFSRWDTPSFWKWVVDFQPEVIFFASGDYAFSYDIARRIAERTGAKLAVCCVDDFYLYNRNEESLLGRLLHRRFLKTVYRTMERAEWIFTICQSQRQAYEALFQKPCRVLHTPALEKGEEGPGNGGITYLGWLELGRHTQLIAIGRALQSLALPGVPRFLDVYSQEQDPRILSQMTLENGIRFRGAVSPEDVPGILGRSMLVVHTESFEEKRKNIVRYSVSAKIPDALMNGGCILAYGPEEVASIAYLKQNGAAYCITRPEDLASGLRSVLTDEGLRREILVRARELAEKNHSTGAGSKLLRQCFGEMGHEDHAN